MNVRTAGRAAAAVAGAGALAALTGGLAHADTPGAGGYDGATSSPSAGSGPESGPEEAGESSGTPVFLLDGLPGAPVPEDLLKPVDLTAPVFGALDGLS